MLENKIILVTGAGSGIGKGCVEKLLDNKAVVIGFDLQKSPTADARYHHYAVDVRDEASIRNVLHEIDNRHPVIDGLVNCAGIFSCMKSFPDISLDEWNKVISTNLTGTFLMSKYVSQRMVKNKKGKIVNISCIRSRIAGRNMSDYAASKGGVVALTSAMAVDLAEYNIQVNSIAPGFTYSAMTEKSFSYPEIKRNGESMIPAGRIANPEDIAKVVLFLLSDLSDYVTGETIFVDGGFKVFK